MSTLRVNSIQTISGNTLLGSTGSVIQVVSIADTSRSDVSISSTWAWSNLALTINRVSTTSKILCQLSCYLSSTGADWDGYLYSSLDGIILRGDASSSRGRGHFSTGTDNAQYSSYATPCHSATVLYTPSNTTSSITITPYIVPEGSITLKLQKDGWNGDGLQAHTLASTLTLLEISA